MKVYGKDIHINPPQWIIIGFLVLILIGTMLLSLPQASTSGESIGIMDAMFMSVSAVCVVGLAIVSVGHDLTTFGQGVLLVLVQLGGLGFMVFGVSVAIILGKITGLKYREFMQPTTRSLSGRGLLRLAGIILCVALSLEAISTVILTIRLVGELGFSDALYTALFHSIAAFNNAGFSLNDQSLEGFIGDPVVNITISALFIIGGLGFMVLVDLYKNRRFKKLSLHSKVVLTTSLALLVVGFIVILAIELFNPETRAMSLSERLWSAYFQSATPRSAGFNTFEISSMLVASQFFIVILMFIGASSGGTGGGIKTNTFVVIILATLNTFRSGHQVHAFRRGIALETVMRALAVVVSSLLFIVLMTLILTMTEGIQDVQFMNVLFEVVSAFSTTGLSMGLTAELTEFGKLLMMITMFVGRLGPLALAFALTYQQHQSRVHYAEEQILVG
ncbi:TrkH family potassium uptake protein [Geomicrobium sediminis]|uniref:Trk system potassium uptake protein TrkH n=1 Tax=Geomicrobium sediminis TaxID=1347788 RepID=A0ABS2PAE2_9BACL|nr:trk system potassium uptake protein TrkH [Geomicrobium sediminis]